MAVIVAEIKSGREQKGYSRKRYLFDYFRHNN